MVARSPANTSSDKIVYEHRPVVGDTALGRIVRLNGQKRFWAIRPDGVEIPGTVDSVGEAEQRLLQAHVDRVAGDALRDAQARNAKLTQQIDALIGDAIDALATIDVDDIAKHLEARLSGDDKEHLSECADALTTLFTHFETEASEDLITALARDRGIALVADLNGGDATAEAAILAERIADGWSRGHGLDYVKPDLDRFSNLIRYEGADFSMYGS